MKNINHPIGNIKIFIIKKTSEFIKATILNILSLLINIKKNQSEIIISRALFAFLDLPIVSKWTLLTKLTFNLTLYI